MVRFEIEPSISRISRISVSNVLEYCGQSWGRCPIEPRANPEKKAFCQFAQFGKQGSENPCSGWVLFRWIGTVAAKWKAPVTLFYRFCDVVCFWSKREKTHRPPNFGQAFFLLRSKDEPRANTGFSVAGCPDLKSDQERCSVARQPLGRKNVLVLMNMGCSWRVVTIFRYRFGYLFGFNKHNLLIYISPSSLAVAPTNNSKQSDTDYEPV